MDSKLVIYQGQLCRQDDRGVVEPVQHPMAQQLVEAVRQGDRSDEYRLLALYHLIANDLEERRSPQLPQIVYVQQPLSNPVKTAPQTIIHYEDRGLLSALGGMVVLLGGIMFLALFLTGYFAIVGQLTRPQPNPIIINR